jgi:hypothetical protein
MVLVLWVSQFLNIPYVILFLVPSMIKKKAVSVAFASFVFLSLLTGPLIAFSQFVTADEPSIPEWHLAVTGLVDNPLNISLSEFKSMPQTTENATLYCVDFPTIPVAGGAMGLWTGVKLSDLLHMAGVKPTAIKVVFYASDGYSTDLSLARAAQDDVLLAYSNNGTNLGEVLRLVVPGNWGYKWISQVARIELVDYNYLGFWESRGYSDEATISQGAPENPSTLPVPTYTQPTPRTPSPTSTVPPSPTPKVTAQPSTTPNPTRTPTPVPTPTSTPSTVQTPSSTALFTPAPEANVPVQQPAFPLTQFALAAAALAAIAVAGVAFLLRTNRRKSSQGT